MKRKLLAIVLVLVMAAVSGCGGTEDAANIPDETNVTDEKKVDYAQYYSPILDEYYNLVYYGEVGEEISSDTGVMEIVSYETPENAANMLGYLIEDISGDGVDELIMGIIDEKTEESCFGDTIVALFCYGEDKPVKTFDGWSRNRYSLLENGDIFYQGSAGAAYSIFGTNTLSADGSELICNDFYFTYEKETFDDIGCFHNTTGEWDKDLAEEMDISTEEFWNIEGELSSQTKSLKLTPIAEYIPVNVPVYEKTVNVMADYAENTSYEDCEFFVADDSEYATWIVFFCDEDVSDFKVLSLFLEDVSEDGTPIFTKTELYETEKLDSEKPLMVEMTFMGDTPSYGISYVNENGETKTFAVEMSGMDGSILLSEI